MIARTSAAIALICALASSASATIWQVNNNTGVSADFATVQEAHDGAVDGDTLYVAGSPTPYGDLTATKTLYIYGPGYFLDENLHNQAYPVPCTIAILTFNVGSEGSSISGATIGPAHNAGAILINANNITVRRNRITNSVTVGAGVVNLTIGQNYLEKGIAVNSGCTNISIFNNLLRYPISVHSSASSDISGNVLEGNGDLNVNNSTVSNNIWQAASGNLNGTSNSIYNNIGAGEIFGTANGNQSNVDMATVFVGAGSTDGQWNLAESSPAIGAGFNGVDCGMFGGSNPYVPSGIPSIPTIYIFDAPEIGTTVGGLPVTMSVKSRN